MQSLGLLLHDCARLLKSEFERRARNHKLSLMQWRTLGTLSRGDGVTQAALATQVEASHMTMSDIVDRLECLKLVRRETDPNDGRAKLVWLTGPGRKVIEEMKEIAAEVYDTALDGLGADDREALVRMLGKISANLNGMAELELTES